MADGRHFEKTSKRDIYTTVTGFGEIWHDDASLLAAADRPLKFRIFEN